LATLAFVFGSVNTVNTHDTILIKGNYAWEVKVFPASDCKATIEENEHPKCAYHVVKKGETLSRIAVRYSAKDYRMTVENILATGKNRTEIAKRVTPRLKKISAKELIEKYQDELTELCKYDNDTKDAFGFVNTWWVFGEVAKELNYKIFMAEVENVGYKRTKRGEKPMPNELYRTNDKGEVLIDDGETKTALDYMRKIEWE